MADALGNVKESLNNSVNDAKQVIADKMEGLGKVIQGVASELKSENKDVTKVIENAVEDVKKELAPEAKTEEKTEEKK